MTHEIRVDVCVEDGPDGLGAAIRLNEVPLRHTN